MELLLICPHCQTNLSLANKSCPCCGASLKDLPPQDRHYIVAGSPREETLDFFNEMVPLDNEIGEIMTQTDYSPGYLGPDTSSLEKNNVSLCEALDRILNKGAVLFGEVLISVADIDLIYLGLQVILASMETARGITPVRECGKI